MDTNWSGMTARPKYDMSKSERVALLSICGEDLCLPIVEADGGIGAIDPSAVTHTAPPEKWGEYVLRWLDFDNPGGLSPIYVHRDHPTIASAE